MSFQEAKIHLSEAKDSHHRLKGISITNVVKPPSRVLPMTSSAEKNNFSKYVLEESKA